MTGAREPWFRLGREVAERILGLGDRDDASPTRGCYDRTYWKYQLIDYPSGWFQGAVEYLVLLELCPGSRFHGSAALRRWIEQAFLFTISRLNGDGSVVEVYPNERSFCATAFAAGHLGAFPGPVGEPERERLLRMADFLDARAFGIGASNQLAAAALGLFRLARLLGEKRLEEAGERTLACLHARQAQEGWFAEYGGLDVGYLTITLSLLARLEAERPGTVDRERATRALRPLETAVAPDGTFDYERTSRRTQFLYPFGLALFESPVLARLTRGLAEERALRPAWLDDRYVIELATDYLYMAHYLEKKEGGA